jgi:hypothetical protein
VETIAAGDVCLTSEFQLEKNKTGASTLEERVD